jgi:Tfp pilus assembly protein PilZ
MSGRDLRRDERVDTSQRVWVEGQDVRVGAEALNMSKGGMFIVTDQSKTGSVPSVDLGSNVEITFDDPEEGRITLAMEVVWAQAEESRGRFGLRAKDRERADAFQRVVERYLEGAHEAANAPSPTKRPSAAEK